MPTPRAIDVAPRARASAPRDAHDLEHVGAIVRRWLAAHVGDGRAAPCAQCGGRVVESVCVDCGVPEVIS